jgi:hypothetical protein
MLSAAGLARQGDDQRPSLNACANRWHDDPGQLLVPGKQSSAHTFHRVASDIIVESDPISMLPVPGEVQMFGRGRALCRKTPPAPGLTATLLLPAPLPHDLALYPVDARG